VPAEFVGHPLADLPQPSTSRGQYSAAHGLDPAAMWIGLLPGSRAKEIRANLPEMLVAAQALVARPPVRDAEMQFLVPLAPTLTSAQRAEVQALIENRPAGSFVCAVEDARAALFHARASIVASGTATVEAALIGNPFVVVYRVSPLTYAIARRVVTVPHVAMANLIAGKRAVPELIQDDFTAANIVQQMGPLLPDGPPRESMMEELKAVGRLLRDVGDGATGESLGAIERVAGVVLELLRRGPAIAANLRAQA
jgi:lipid-A-disaccharide synthase